MRSLNSDTTVLANFALTMTQMVTAIQMKYNSTTNGSTTTTTASLLKCQFTGTAITRC